jgi:hypothetical protein
MRFTIREVLWLTVIVALVLGWWIDHSQLSLARSQLKTLIVILESHGIHVSLQSQGVRASVVREQRGNRANWTHYQAFGTEALSGIDP